MRKKGSRSLPTGGWVETLARVPKDVKIVDICREHRCIQGWVYGMAEVWPAHIERKVRVPTPAASRLRRSTRRRCCWSTSRGERFL
jgi:hypothetical protein